MLFRRPKPRPLFFLARAHGLAYLQIPKVACTSLRVEIAALNRPELKPELQEDGRRIHRNMDWNDIAGEGDAALGNLFRFTFVRHPVERFMSMNRNKVLRGTQADGVPPSMACCGIYAGMPLPELLDIVEKLQPLELDPHMVPQSWLIFGRSRPRVDFVGRLEQMSDGLEAIAKKTGIRLEVGHHNRTSVPAGGAPAPEQIKRIERFYAEDFERLGYKRSENHAIRWSRFWGTGRKKPIAKAFSAAQVFQLGPDLIGGI